METSAATLAELAAELSPAPQTLLIEHNAQALLRSQWETTPIQEGDVLEILRVSAGG
jgi:thiamine biosynthesis protein ThiS